MSFAKMPISYSVPKITSVTKYGQVSNRKVKTVSVKPKTVSYSRKTKVNLSKFSEKFNSLLKIKLIRVPKLWLPALNLALVFGVLSLIGFHLFAVNSYSGKGAELKKLQVSNQSLDNSNKQLMVKQSQEASISQLSDFAQNSGLVAITVEEYILANSQISHR